VARIVNPNADISVFQQCQQCIVQSLCVMANAEFITPVVVRVKIDTNIAVGIQGNAAAVGSTVLTEDPMI